LRKNLSMSNKFLIIKYYLYRFKKKFTKKQKSDKFIY